MKVRGKLIASHYRANNEVEAEIEVDPLRVDWNFHGLEFVSSSQCARRNGQDVYLQAQEAKVLASIVMRGGFATKNEIYLDAWNFIPKISRRLDVHASILRRKLLPLGAEVKGGAGGFRLTVT